MKHIWFLILSLLLFSCNPTQQSKDKQTDNNGDNSQIKIEQRVLTTEDIYNNSIDKVSLILCYENGIPSAQGSGFDVK